MAVTPTIELRGGLKMPMIGFGTWIVSLWNAFSLIKRNHLKLALSSIIG